MKPNFIMLKYALSRLRQAKQRDENGTFNPRETAEVREQANAMLRKHLDRLCPVPDWFRLKPRG